MPGEGNRARRPHDGRTTAFAFRGVLFLSMALMLAHSQRQAVMAERVRSREERVNNLEMRLALEKLANGGWGIRFDEDLDPAVARSVKSVNAVMDNLARALERVVAQNEELRSAASDALLQLAYEKERIEARIERPKPPAT